ncbi:class I SAM-dependent methyltransferase [Reichenbachiella sp.]
MSKNYLDIVKHYESCFDTHGDSAKGVDWPNEKGAELRYQVMLDIIKHSSETQETYSLLDFGCGTATLNEYITRNGISHINYSGLDLSETYIAASKKKFPDHQFHQVDILTTKEKLPTFDFVVANGVFTEKRELSFEEMWDYFQKMMLRIYPMANKGIAFNVMSKAVDWERWDLFHVPTDLLINFIVKNFKRHFVIRNDYGLFEYTVYLYK